MKCDEKNTNTSPEDHRCDAVLSTEEWKFLGNVSSNEQALDGKGSGKPSCLMDKARQTMAASAIAGWYHGQDGSLAGEC